MSDVRKAERKKLYTYGDYLNWPEDQRWEILDGEAFAMTPAPTTDHQRISRELTLAIGGWLAGKPCEMFVAPVDVLMPKGNEADEKITTVVQPDILVVCDPDKVKRRGIRGAPDFVIEIVSPATVSRDQVRKRRLYERHGVREYWVVHPDDRLVTVYRRAKRGETFAASEVFDVDGLQLEVGVLPGLVVDFGRVFPARPVVVRESPGPYPG